MPSTVTAKSPFSKSNDQEARTPYSKTFWLAGPAPLCPQPIVMVKGRKVGLRFVNGRLTVTNEEDAEAVKQALGATVFEEDFPEGQPAIVLEPLNYAPRSFGAQAAYQRLINAVGR